MAVGALVNGSAPDWVLGKAMTSRMFSSPTSSATRRSMPSAKPACGGHRSGRRRAGSRTCAGPRPRRCREPEDLPLHVGPVDPDAARTELPAVEHQVVGLGAHGQQRLGVTVAGRHLGQEPEVLGVRHRERVVRRDRSSGGGSSTRTTEVDDPQQLGGRPVDGGRPSSRRSRPST